MSLLTNIRQNIIERLWQSFSQHSTQARMLRAKLPKFTLDHFAVIDLPGAHTGISQLSQIFSALGFMVRGHGYLVDKQNRFSWLAEKGCDELLAVDALPQVVVADFCIDMFPLEVKKIIEKYAKLATPFPLPLINKLINKIELQDQKAVVKLCDLITNYFSGRDWPLPTLAEFKTVHAFNELLAWVLVFGRKPNHFTVAVHLMPEFSNLEMFNKFVQEDLILSMNDMGGQIKGGIQVGIAQSATIGQPVCLQLADGIITLPDSFIEFVWRYPKNTTAHAPVMWNDYFPDFVADNANSVIESLYIHK